MKLRGLQDSFQLFMKSPSFQILLTYGGMEAVTKTREMKAKQWILAPISPFPHRSTHHQSHTYTYTHNLHTQTHTTHSKSTLSQACTHMLTQITSKPLEMIEKVRQRKTTITWHHLFVESKKYTRTHLRNRNRHTDIANKLMVTTWESGVGDKLEVWD